MQVHLSENYIPTVILSPNYTSPPSMVATFLATYLVAVMQSSGYSIFYNRDTLINISTLKPLLRIIKAILLKLQASLIAETCI